MKSKPTYQELEKENKILSEKFRSFFDNNKAIMLQINSSTTQITKANKVAVNFYGYSENELLQKTVSDLSTLPPDKISTIIKEEVNNKSNFFEFQHKLSNGKIKDVEVYVSPFNIDDKTHMIATIYDITYRKKAERELKQRGNYLVALNKTSEILTKGEHKTQIQKFIEIIGKVAHASRTYIFKNHKSEENELLLSQIAEYVTDGIKPEVDNPQLQNLSYNDWLPRWYKTLKKGKIVKGKVADFPQTEREILEPQEIKAVLIIPIMIGKEFWGFIGFDNCINDNDWQTTEIEYLKASAEKISTKLEEQRKQKQLENENKRFHATMDSIDAVVYVADMQTYELLFVNEKLRKLLGNKVGEKCYNALQGLDTPCDFCTNNKLLDKNGNPNEPYIWEFQNKVSKQWYQCRDQAIQWIDSRLVRIEIATDITNNKKAEEALKISEAQLRQIIDLVPHFIFVKDETGKFEIVNKATAEVFGTTVEDLTGRRDSEFVATEEEIEDFRADDIEVINSGKTKFIPEEPITDSENNTRYLQTTKVPFKLSDTNKPSLLGVAVDITDRKKAVQALKESEAKLRESNATKDKFFSIIAHDLKSPFNAILGFSKILLKKHKKYDDEKREKIIKSVNDSANSAFSLLENLLTWSRSQSGKITYTPEKLHLKILLSETMYELQAAANQKEIQLIETISDNEMIFADKSMITTILRNLISNAIKFTNRAGNITISSKKQENSDFVEISVADTGVGIPKDKIDDLFRIDKNTSTQGTENETGTGLGLILCKEFIEKHGGEIWVESKEGIGSTFLFSIPQGQINNN